MLNRLIQLSGKIESYTIGRNFSPYIAITKSYYTPTPTHFFNSYWYFEAKMPMKNKKVGGGGRIVGFRDDNGKNNNTTSRNDCYQS